ncbi:MAG: DUF86 domain-containing protein [Candidatus Altiarchaeota archaeon]|nr:DUF86 domain-containing protein [Candidatus Altiarchaeota archaeon]
MHRNHKLLLDDILEAADRIQEYTKNLTLADFKKNKLKVDATLRNLEVIGEATKNIPEEVKKKNPQIEWKKMAGLRDILIHAYPNIDIETIWDIIENKIPELKKQIKEIR